AGPLKAAGAALAELADRENLRGGLNIHATDSLHAYEEGINHLALMSRWFYGDPIYFERCMESARNMEALTIRTADGRRHFRTTVRMGAEDIETPREPNVDGHANPLMWHTALQVADYNRNPEALRLLREWGDTWLRYQNPGEFATAVDVVSGDVVDSYENRPLYGGYSTQASVFTWLYALTGDAKYVEPFTLYYRRGEAPYPSNGYLPDVWALGGMGDLGRETLAPLAGRSAALALYALGDHGPAMARAIGKARASTAQISSLSDAARWPDMYTTAHQFTDRVFPDIQSHASQAYLGGHMRRNRMHPTLAVSWAGFGSDYAALVRENGRDHLRVSVYSYADEPTRGRMTVWALDHGVYDLAAGTDGDSAGGRGTRRVELAKGESVAVTLPPGEATTIELTQVARLDSVFARADLAVAERELRVEDGHVHARIHNIGAAPAADVLVALVDSEGSQVGEPATVSLEAPLDLRPRSVDVKLRLPPTPTHGLRVAIDPANTVPEIYEGNNTAPAPLP
ncbi:hypothetical protein HOI71_14625, partial [Candidatus Poribacteria bacterium]|nr:hypothetical protein [Candidatus Poribacteria bacterium]